MLFFVAFFAILFVNVGATCAPPNATNCPALCQCNDVEVRCERLKLSRVPNNLPNSVRALTLSNNNIRDLLVSDFVGCSQLNELDLSNNLLRQIDGDLFRGALNLQRLLLRNNYIQHIDFDSATSAALKHLDLSYNLLRVSTLPNGTFCSLSKLEELDLRHNIWQKDFCYNDQLFIPLKNLKILKIDGLPNEAFPKGFAELMLLDELFITGGLNIIFNETFAVFEANNLTTLNVHTDTIIDLVVTDSSLVWLEPMSFGHFKRLKSLDLSYNSNLTLKAASNAWFGLQFTQIKELRLNNVTPRSRLTEELDETFFTHLNLTNITLLELAANNLVYIKPVLSKYLHNLVHLDLSINQLFNSIGLVEDCANLARLTVLRVTAQRCPSRQFADFSKERMSKLDGDDSTSPHRGDSFASCQPLTTRVNDEFNVWPSRQHLSRQSVPLCVPLASNLKEINLFSSLFVNQHALPPLNITRGGENLRKIHLGENGLHHVCGPIVFQNPPSNLAVYLTSNQMASLNPELFTAAKDQQSKVKVTELYLRNNNLGTQLLRDSEGSTFSNYPFLTVLDLKLNGITYLNAKVFQQLTHLRTLLLSGNGLRSVDFELKHMTRLSVLDLSNNDITSLNSTHMQTFVEMFSRVDSKLMLRLNGNPIRCSCDTLTFLHWMSQNRGRIEDFQRISCLFLDESVNFMRLQEFILVELDYVCRNSVAVVVSGTLLGLAIILIAASAFCYRHRWEIRYACIKLTQKGQRYQRIVNETVHYTYDAFVIYDSGDRNWVNDLLVPRLENGIAGDSQSSNAAELQLLFQTTTGNLRLCVHERDFPPGEDILGNIWSKMEKSRKVIIIISKNFTLSHYCEYEMNLARMQSVEQGRNVIIPIVLEMPDMNKVSDCLSWLMRKVTYIEWPQDESDRDEFWETLHETLVDRE